MAGIVSKVPVIGKPAAKLLGEVTGVPKPPEAPKTPSTQTTAVQQVASETAQRRSRARGFRSTILSSLAPETGLKDTYGS